MRSELSNPAHLGVTLCVVIAGAAVLGCSDGRRPPASQGILAAAAPVTSGTSVASQTQAQTSSAASDLDGAASLDASLAAGATRAQDPTSQARASRDASANDGGRGEAASETASDDADASGVRLHENAFVAFGVDVTVSDMVVPVVPSMRHLAFVVEGDGTLRVLDVSATTPVLMSAFPLFAEPVKPPRTLGRLSVLGPTLALLPTRGPGFEGVAVFDPSVARGPGDVTWLDMNELRVTWPAGTNNSQGVAVGGRPLPVTRMTGAVVSGQRLIFISANTDADRDHNPGTVAAFAFDPTTRQVKGEGRLLRTSRFNPTGLTQLRTPLGELLLVTNTGSFGQSGASVDVIDPVTFTRVGTIALPNAEGDVPGAPSSARVADPFGPMLVSPNGQRGYLGSLTQARVYVFDLAGLAPARVARARDVAPAPVDLSDRYLGSTALPTQAGRNAVTRLALSDDGRYLYAVNHGESALYRIDLLEPSNPTRVDGFARDGDPAAFEGLLSGIALRPGDDPERSVFAITTDLARPDRMLPGVRLVLDRVSFAGESAAAE